jgi:hypothetical protein
MDHVPILSFLLEALGSCVGRIAVKHGCFGVLDSESNTRHHRTWFGTGRCEGLYAERCGE